MPKGNGTGPDEEGRRTGRKLGLCSGNNAPGSENNTEPRQGKARGQRNGQGQGLGLRNGQGRNKK
ncbi:DUF5320 domain-containing protein [Candidatus Woesearchaeota archaeon]|nr:DUF5320 domain-containing protein [Candidatus Woesearchaeota archaeon]